MEKITKLDGNSSIEESLNWAKEFLGLKPDQSFQDLDADDDDEEWADFSRFFERIEDVPTKALTMGMGSILKSRKIVILINGDKKSKALKELLSGMIDTHNPSTLLNVHSDVVVICDQEAYDAM